MVKVQAIMDFTYKKYDKIQNLNSLDEIEKGKNKINKKKEDK